MARPRWTAPQPEAATSTVRSPKMLGPINLRRPSLLSVNLLARVLLFEFCVDVWSLKLPMVERKFVALSLTKLTSRIHEVDSYSLALTDVATLYLLSTLSVFVDDCTNNFYFLSNKIHSAVIEYIYKVNFSFFTISSDLLLISSSQL